MDVPHDRVWAAISDLSSHPEWMKDAESVVFLDEQRRGNGTRMEVKTVLGPFRTVDVMEVVGWEEGRSIEVAHRGAIEGRGKLEVTRRGEGAIVTWEETLLFPWWLGGGVGAGLAGPVLASVWRGNLRRLEESLGS